MPMPNCSSATEATIAAALQHLHAAQLQCHNLAVDKRCQSLAVDKQCQSLAVGKQCRNLVVDKQCRNHVVGHLLRHAVQRQLLVVILVHNSVAEACSVDKLFKGVTKIIKTAAAAKSQPFFFAHHQAVLLVSTQIKNGLFYPPWGSSYYTSQARRFRRACPGRSDN